MKNPFTITSQEGEIRLNNERMIITSSSIFGTLRKDLIENIGLDRMKGFLIRYGWNLGVNDANKSLHQKYSNVEEILRRGPILHMLQGYTKVQTTMFKLDIKNAGVVNTVEVEGRWINSYEAEEHIIQLGQSYDAVCHTLIGYASGYYSMICGHDVIFKEVACKGMGDAECRYEGKSIHLWDAEIQNELKYYKTQPIVEELAITYEKLFEERNILAKVMEIHNQLMEEVMNGRNLQSIARMIFQMTGIPLLIENWQNGQVYSAGFEKKQEQEVRKQIYIFTNFQQESSKQTFIETVTIQQEECEILLSPISLQKSIYGYCAFFCQKNEKSRQDYLQINQMILERVAMVGSILLLNEKASFESLERAKGQLLEQILNKELQSREEIMKKSRYLGSPLEPFFSIAVIEHKLLKKQVEDDYFIQQKMLEIVYYFFKKQNQTVLTAQRDGYIVLLIPVQKEDSNSSISEHCRKTLEHLAAAFSACHFKAGVSSISCEWDDIEEIYQEAVTAVKMNKIQQSVTLFQDVNLLGILMHTSSSTVLQKAKKVLEPLLDHENPKMYELLRTLYIFLQCGGNLEKTMDEMSISMSGLRYRLKKIEKLLNCDIREPLNSFQLYASIEALVNANEIRWVE